MLRSLATAAALVAAQLAAAGAPGPPLSTIAKALSSDAVILGRVTGIETEAMDVLPYPKAPAKVKVNVATVKVETALLGAKNLTVMKVLIEANPARPRPGHPGPPSLTDGQDGLFFLSKHPTADGHFALPYASSPVGRNLRTFEQDVAEVKRVADAVADPLKALADGQPADRLATASLLVEWYRRPVPGQPTEEVAIPAEQTKAILKVLRDADWSAGANIREYRLTPLMLLDRIGLSPGWPGGLPALNPRPGDDLNVLAQAAFKAWHAKNADKFEIKKLVPKAK